MELTSLEKLQRRKKRIGVFKNIFVVATVFFLAVGVLMILPDTVMAANQEQIKTSINKGTKDITSLVTNISAGVATAVLVGAFLFNMIPNQEISQKAKSIIFRVCASLFGISIVGAIVSFIQSLGN